MSSWKSHRRPDQVSAEYFFRMRQQKKELVVLRGVGGPENGKWYDRGRMKVRDPDEDEPDDPAYVISAAHVHFGPTGEFETSDDGKETAEVFRPVVCPDDCERKSDQGSISCQGCNQMRIYPPREHCLNCEHFMRYGWS